MINFLKKLFAKKPEFGTGLDLDRMRVRDPRNFNGDALGTWWSDVFGYTPQNTYKLNQPFSVKNQYQQNSCVVESGAIQKEPDENVELAVSWMCAHLRSKGLMGSKGTSLLAFQKELKNVGMPEKRFGTRMYLSPWEGFASYDQLTQESYDNAATHKIESYFDTYKLDTILQWLDQGKIIQTGCEWFTGYNPSAVGYPYILEPQKGTSVGGHAFDIIGYNLNYQNDKVLICVTSYGYAYNNGQFYIRFSDFSKILTFGSFFNTDIPKDTAAFLSINAMKPILEKNGPKVYIIEADKKRWIPDEGLMWMLEITPSMLVHDKDGVLDAVQEGEPMSIKDIPAKKLEENKYFVAMSKDQQFMRERFAKYFPDLFIK